jgi:hypothetical protein
MPPQAVLDVVASASPFDRLPLTIDQTSSRASALIMLLLLVPALLVGLVPTALLVAFASSSLGVAADHPGAAAQVLVGIGLWTVLFVLPAKRIVQRFGFVRKIHVDSDTVTVSERGLFGSQRWTVPLSDYTGITRHLRSTLSGLRHELILVHREPRKSVLLHSGDLASAPAIDQAKRLLRLPEIQPRELYRRRTFRPAAAPTGPVVARIA